MRPCPPCKQLPSLSANITTEMPSVKVLLPAWNKQGLFSECAFVLTLLPIISFISGIRMCTEKSVKYKAAYNTSLLEHYKLCLITGYCHYKNTCYKPPSLVISMPFTCSYKPIIYCSYNKDMHFIETATFCTVVPDGIWVCVVKYKT